jgi:hypothetical protein
MFLEQFRVVVETAGELFPPENSYTEEALFGMLGRDGVDVIRYGDVVVSRGCKNIGGKWRLELFGFRDFRVNFGNRQFGRWPIALAFALNGRVGSAILAINIDAVLSLRGAPVAKRTSPNRTLQEPPQLIAAPSSPITS